MRDAHDFTPASAAVPRPARDRDRDRDRSSRLDGGAPSDGVGAARRLSWREQARHVGVLRATRTALLGAPKAKALRPTGHSAVIERLRIPVIVSVSLSLTCGATYVLARSLVIQFIASLGAHAWGVLIPDAIALFPVLMTGLVLDYTFVTASTRFQMHVLRGEWGWWLAALVAMILTGVTEAATVAYLFYEIEPTSVVGGVSLQIVTAIPGALFWVRAGGALVCLAYLVTCVLPLVIQRGDLKHLAAARSGGTAMSVMDQLLTVPGVSTREQQVQALSSLFAIFDFSTRRPGEKSAADTEFAELTDHLGRLNQIGGAPTPVALPPPTPSGTQRYQRMHDGDLGDRGEPGRPPDDRTGEMPDGPYAAYDAWENAGAWDRQRGEAGARRSGRDEPGDQDDDPFGSGMYHPRLDAFGQPGPSSRAARQAKANGHHRPAGGDSLGALITPTSYTASARPTPSSLSDDPDVAGRTAGGTRTYAPLPAHLRRPKSTRRDAGRSRAEITREALERETMAFRILDADPDLGPRPLARRMAQELGYPVNTKDASSYRKLWRANHGYDHIHLGDYPYVPGADGADGPMASQMASQMAEEGDPSRSASRIADELDAEFAAGDERYATWALPSEAVQQMSDAARRAWHDLRADEQARDDDPDSGLA